MKGKFVNIALLVGSVVFSLLSIEVGLRVYKGEWRHINFRFPEGNWFEANHPVSYDAELGWAPKPDVRTNILGTTVTILEGGIRSNSNEEGRDGTGDPILAVGDSYTFGDQVSDWETWPAELEKLARRKVINAGVFGYGIDQAFLRARHLLSRYRFSTVVFSFIPDDIRRCQMSANYGRAKSYFDFRDGRLTLENVPVPLPVPLPKENIVLVALEHSLLVHTVMTRLFPKWWLGPAWEIQVHDKDKGNKVACSLLHNLEGVTHSRGSELIVLVEHGNWEGVAEATAVKNVLSCLSDPVTRVLDLEPALSEFKAKDRSRYDRLYQPSGGHMTAEGNQFVAREILPLLTER
jgi:hypothetical protein